MIREKGGKELEERKEGEGERKEAHSKRKGDTKC